MKDTLPERPDAAPHPPHGPGNETHNYEGDYPPVAGASCGAHAEHDREHCEEFLAVIGAVGHRRREQPCRALPPYGALEVAPTRCRDDPREDEGDQERNERSCRRKDENPNDPATLKCAERELRARRRAHDCRGTRAAPRRRISKL